MRRARLLINTEPLRSSPNFRRLWVGQSLSSLGGQITVYAVMLQVYRESGTSLAVGGVGLAFVVPSIATALLAGGVIDTLDRRRLVLATTSLQALVSALLAVNAYTSTGSLALVYVLVAAQGAVGAVNAPARGTFMPRLLRRDQLHAGAALETFAMHASSIAGPALAGVIASVADLRVCYLVDVVSFTAALYGVARLPAMRPERAAGGGLGLKVALAGLGYVARTPIVLQAFLADMSLTVLGTPNALLPALNQHRFGAHPQVLGLLLAAPAVGGALGTAFSGPLGEVRRQGRAMLVLVCAWGAAITLLGLSPVASLAVTCLVVAGALDALAVTMRSAVVQATIPDEMRGRVGSLDYVVGVGGPQLGSFRAGALSSGFGPGTAAVIGGVSSLLGAGSLLPLARQLTGYERLPESAPTSEPVEKETSGVDS